MQSHFEKSVSELTSIQIDCLESFTSDLSETAGDEFANKSICSKSANINCAEEADCPKSDKEK